MGHLLSFLKRLSNLQRLKLLAAAGFLVAGLAALATSLVLYSTGQPTAGPPPGEAEQQSDSAGAESAPKTSAQTITVDVSGGVEHPGVYHLPLNARVADAVTAAGQFSNQANMLEVMEKLNLAEKLEDSQKVFIPVTGIKTPAAETKETAQKADPKKKASPKPTAKKTTTAKKE